MSKKNTLDSFHSIQLPLQNPSSASKILLNSLTHPSKLSKRNGSKVVGTQSKSVRKKRKLECPDIFDHLAMLRLKQQKCRDERVSQKVPVSPILDTSCSDFLSLHPSPSKSSEEEKVEMAASSFVSFEPLEEAQSEPGIQCLGEEKIVRPTETMEEESGQPFVFSTCPSWDDGNSQEFKTSVPASCFFMEHGRPSTGRSQLARVPSGLSPERVICEDSSNCHPRWCATSGLPLAVSLSSLAGQQQQQDDGGRESLGPVDGRSFSICHFYPREE